MALTKPIEQIVSGIDAFKLAVEAWIDSGEWKVEHEDKLFQLSLEMNKLRLHLVRLQQETW